MSTYAIGDIQGCYSSFCRLLEKIKFDPGADRLWLVGDLVNRGGKSLQVLRMVYQLRDSVTCVLGNHDLHLLAASEVQNGKHKNAEFVKIFRATDSDELLEWLRLRPLVAVDESARLMMVHAGIAPGWTFKKTLQLAGKVGKRLAGKAKPRKRFFTNMYGNKPDVWQPELDPDEELRVITNTFTRMRYCKASGVMSFTESGQPGTQGKEYQPWFMHSRRVNGYTILFGHWSTLGLYFGHQVMCLDSGCVWGGTLTAVRLAEQFNVIQVKGRPG